MDALHLRRRGPVSGRESLKDRLFQAERKQRANNLSGLVSRSCSLIFTGYLVPKGGLVLPVPL